MARELSAGECAHCQKWFGYRLTREKAHGYNVVAVIGFAPEPIESGTAHDEPKDNGNWVVRACDLPHNF